MDFSPAAVAASEGFCTNPNDGSGECSAKSSTGSGNLNSYKRLSPSDLPSPHLFDEFGPPKNVSISEDLTMTVIPGSLQQQGDTRFESELVVMPNFLPREVVAEMLRVLRGHENADAAGGKTTVDLDNEPDSVDGMTSQEIFLDNDSLRQGLPSKSDPSENLVGRSDFRKKLRALTDPYLETALVPFLEKWFGTEKCGRPNRNCTPCYSLIRRYRAGERQSHAPHHDAHAFVTVVVSLTDYGTEYTGGLYVSTKNSEKHFLKLDRGDAVAHEGNLHHGVKVLDTRDDGGPSERWSWVMWFRDSDTCEDHGNEWHHKCSEAGNPTCMYMRASRQSEMEEILKWNRLASDAGHAQASVKLAYAYLKRLASDLPYDRERARQLFEAAVVSSNEPDGHYGLAALYLEGLDNRIMQEPTETAKSEAAAAARSSPDMMWAIRHLEEAARGDHVFAMFNLGICHTYGYGRADGFRDYPAAVEWFEASGLPEGFFAKASYLQVVAGNNATLQQQALDFQERARILGFGAPWRVPARERTGSGGSGGAKLNLVWPSLPNGERPPRW